MTPTIQLAFPSTGAIQATFSKAPRSLAWVTDLGYVPEHVKMHLREIQTIVIESNYDEELLEKDTRRPWSTKQRIRARHGHLSNDAAYDLIEQLNSTGTLQTVHLAHLSKDCNSTEKVRARFSALEGGRLKIHVIDPASSIIPAPSQLTIHILPSCPSHSKKTKIIFTVGPATADEKTLKSLILAGVDICRIQYSSCRP